MSIIFKWPNNENYLSYAKIVRKTFILKITDRFGLRKSKNSLIGYIPPTIGDIAQAFVSSRLGTFKLSNTPKMMVHYKNLQWSSLGTKSFYI